MVCAITSRGRQSNQNIKSCNMEDPDLSPPEEWYEGVLRCGLSLGAAFQLACIAAIFLKTDKPQGNSEVIGKLC